MLIEKRLAAILKAVNDKGSITVADLTKQLGTSESTIRRDLNLLDRDGRLKKVHGGATAIGAYYEKNVDKEVQRQANWEEKTIIVKYAASLIGPGDFVYLDAGITDLLVDYIREKNAVYVTNAVSHAKKLVQNGLEAHLLGGKYKVSEAVTGNETISLLEQYNFTLGFWGADGASLKQGFTTTDIDDAMVKKKAMEQCKDRYVLCDCAKFNQVWPVTFADFNFATVITSRLLQKGFEECTNIVEAAQNDIHSDL